MSIEKVFDLEQLIYLDRDVTCLSVCNVIYVNRSNSRVTTTPKRTRKKTRNVFCDGIHGVMFQLLRIRLRGVFLLLHFAA